MEAVTPLIEGGQYMCLLQTMVWLAHDACTLEKINTKTSHNWKSIEFISTLYLLIFFFFFCLNFTLITVELCLEWKGRVMIDYS